MQSAISTLQQLSANPEKLKSYCPVALLLAHRQKSLTPQDLAVASQVAQNCPQNPAAKAIPKEGEKADELLNRSGADKNVEVRANAKINAAMLAKSQDHDPERAIEILEGMSEEEKQATPRWSNMWWIIALDLLRKYVPEMRTAEIERLAQTAPNDRKTDFLVTYSQLLEHVADPNSALRTLEEARKSLADSEDGSIGVALVNLYARFVPEEGPAVLQETVAAINRQKPCDPRSRGACRFRLGVSLEPTYFGIEVLDLDPGLVRAAISDVKNQNARASLRLGLIRAALMRYEQKLAVAR